MATYEKNGQLTYLDASGEKHLLFPKTKIPQVEGLEDALAGKAPASHVNDKNNPHGVTIAQIGAAPAGYGLGSVAGADKWNGDANALTKQGWYRLESGTTNGVGESASVRVDGYAETGLTQTAYTRTGFKRIRTCVDGVWSSWEWVNPPMRVGVEYRTTERWYDKPVYTALIYYGKGKTSGTFNIQTAPVTGLNVRFIDAFCKAEEPNTGWGISLDRWLSFGEYGSNNAVFAVTHNDDLSNHDIYLTVKYYKV